MRRRFRNPWNPGFVYLGVVKIISLALIVYLCTEMVVDWTASSFRSWLLSLSRMFQTQGVQGYLMDFEI